MKYFYLRGSINEELFKKFIEFCNEGHEKVSVIIDTSGGSGTIAQTIAAMISDMQEATIIIHYAYSAGMDIALKAKCKKRLANDCRGMYHYGYRSLDINDKGLPTWKEDECVKKHLPVIKKNSEDFARQFLNDSEFKKFKKGDDVYFNATRMKEIFPNAEIIP